MYSVMPITEASRSSSRRSAPPLYCRQGFSIPSDVSLTRLQELQNRWDTALINPILPRNPGNCTYAAGPLPSLPVYFSGVPKLLSSTFNTSSPLLPRNFFPSPTGIISIKRTSTSLSSARAASPIQSSSPGQIPISFGIQCIQTDINSIQAIRN